MQELLQVAVADWAALHQDSSGQERTALGRRKSAYRSLPSEVVMTLRRAMMSQEQGERSQLGKCS